MSSRLVLNLRRLCLKFEGEACTTPSLELRNFPTPPSYGRPRCPATDTAVALTPSVRHNPDRKVTPGCDGHDYRREYSEYLSPDPFGPPPRRLQVRVDVAGEVATNRGWQ